MLVVWLTEGAGGREFAQGGSAVLVAMISQPSHICVTPPVIQSDFTLTHSGQRMCLSYLHLVAHEDLLCAQNCSRCFDPSPYRACKLGVETTRRNNK